MSDLPNYADSEELLQRILDAQKGQNGAFDALLLQYTPLIEHQLAGVRARRPDLGAEDEKDLRQEAHLAFYRALRNYNTDRREVTFGLYAKICMENAMISAMRKMHPVTEPLDARLVADLPAGGEQDPTRRLREQEDYEALCRRIAGSLSPYENAIWQRYIAGQTAAGIAATFGKDVKSIHNAIYRIRSKLRKEMEKQ